jgi:hypothetical protein
VNEGDRVRDAAASWELSVEERLVLLDQLWVPAWAERLSATARRMAALVEAALEGRPYVGGFARELDSSSMPLVGPWSLRDWAVELLGVASDQADNGLFEIDRAHTRLWIDRDEGHDLPRWMLNT